MHFLFRNAYAKVRLRVNVGKWLENFAFCINTSEKKIFSIRESEKMLKWGTWIYKHHLTILKTFWEYL